MVRAKKLGHGWLVQVLKIKYNTLPSNLSCYRISSHVLMCDSSIMTNFVIICIRTCDLFCISLNTDVHTCSLDLVEVRHIYMCVIIHHSQAHRFRIQYGNQYFLPSHRWAKLRQPAYHLVRSWHVQKLGWNSLSLITDGLALKPNAKDHHYSSQIWINVPVVGREDTFTVRSISYRCLRKQKTRFFTNFHLSLSYPSLYLSKP